MVNNLLPRDVPRCDPRHTVVWSPGTAKFKKVKKKRPVRAAFKVGWGKPPASVVIGGARPVGVSSWGVS